MAEQPTPHVVQAHRVDSSVVSRESLDPLASAWRKNMMKNLDLPSGYERVGVLMIKWKEGQDRYIEEEFSSLRGVLEDKFGYEVETVELETAKKPQNQLNRAVSSFIEEFDCPSERNLMMFYYTGHGSWNLNEQTLDFLRVPGNAQSTLKGKACWDPVDRAIKDADVDALVILDTCYAATLQGKGYNPGIRSYEILAASPPWKETEPAGEHSFTAALIKSLEDLSRKTERFSTHYLHQTICRYKQHNTPFIFKGCKVDSSPIFLHPISKRRHAESPTVSRTLSKYLALQFRIGIEDFDERVIEKMTKGFVASFRDMEIDLHNIDYISFKTYSQMKEERERKHAFSHPVILSWLVDADHSGSSSTSSGASGQATSSDSGESYQYVAERIASHDDS